MDECVLSSLNVSAADGGTGLPVQADPDLLRHIDGWSANASVRSFGSFADEGLRSPSAYSDSDGGFASVLPLRDPEQMLRGIISCGASVSEATRIVLAYYKAEAGRVVKPETNVVQSTTSKASSSSARRMEAWRHEVAAMAEREGQCYLRVLRWGRRKAYSRVLGDSPLLRDFIAMLEPGDLDVDVAKSMGFFRIGFGIGNSTSYHIASDCAHGVRLGTVYDCIAGFLRAYPFVNQHIQCDTAYSTPLIPLVGTVGISTSSNQESPRVLVSAPDLSLLVDSDFGQCRCRIHVPPLTRESNFAAEGCCKKPVGRAGVIANAFIGVPGMCHASEATRHQDHRMLRYMVSPVDPGILDGRSRPPELARLCTSSINVDINAFGNGYCYLSLLQRDCWWRAVRLLGPNPKLSSLCRAILWMGKPASRMFEFKEVADGYYHVVPAKHIKGIVATAGARVYAQAIDILAVNEHARVGYANEVVDLVASALPPCSMLIPDSPTDVEEGGPVVLEQSTAPVEPGNGDMHLVGSTLRGFGISCGVTTGLYVDATDMPYRPESLTGESRMYILPRVGFGSTSRADGPPCKIGPLSNDLTLVVVRGPAEVYTQGLMFSVSSSKPVFLLALQGCVLSVWYPDRIYRPVDPVYSVLVGEERSKWLLRFGITHGVMNRLARDLRAGLTVCYGTPRGWSSGLPQGGHVVKANTTTTLGGVGFRSTKFKVIGGFLWIDGIVCVPSGHTVLLMNSQERVVFAQTGDHAVMLQVNLGGKFNAAIDTGTQYVPARVASGWWSFF